MSFSTGGACVTWLENGSIFRTSCLREKLLELLIVAGGDDPEAFVVEMGKLMNAQKKLRPFYGKIIFLSKIYGSALVRAGKPSK